MRQVLAPGQSHFIAQLPRKPHQLCTDTTCLTQTLITHTTEMLHFNTLIRWTVDDSIVWHDDVIKCKHFLRYWPFVWRIHWSPVNSLNKGQWPGALMFSLMCTWINGWVNNCEAGDLKCQHAHYDVTVVEVMVWHQAGNKPLIPQPIMTLSTFTYMQDQVSVT